MRKRHGNFLLGIIMILVLGGSLLMNSCTDNIRAKKFGGEMTINLEPGQKLINVTWKDSDLWVLTRKMTSTETPEVFTFVENSTWGMLEGTITLIESSVNSPTSELTGTPIELPYSFTIRPKREIAQVYRE